MVACQLIDCFFICVFFFFFYLGFLSESFKIHRAAREGESYFFNISLHFFIVSLHYQIIILWLSTLLVLLSFRLSLFWINCMTFVKLLNYNQIKCKYCIILVFCYIKADRVFNMIKLEKKTNNGGIEDKTSSYMIDCFFLQNKFPSLWY